MSAIAGIIHFDGAPVPRSDLERMSQALEPFGRDGQHIVIEANAGFVARIAHVTPEDRLDRQPSSLADRSRLLFDGRLDNRADVIRELGLGGEARLLADSALAARAWERWGRECLSRLIGVFSLVHWDPALRRATFARSAPRGRPLFIHRQGACLQFASAPHGLYALPQVPRALDESALGDWLLRNTGSGETIYRDIRIVRNAHWTEHAPEGEKTGRHWAPDPEHRLRFRREEDAWEAFAPLFEEVVGTHLRAIRPVGIQMSGGLDSAAVAGQAARLLAAQGKPLYGYTRVPAPGTPLRPDGLFYNDERPRVSAIAQMHPNLRPCFVDAGDEPVLDGLQDRFASSYFVPLVSSTFVTGYQALYRRAAADGVGVLLTGFSGNFTFTYDGHARLRHLLLAGRWPALVRELRALKRFRGTVRDLIRSELIESLVPHGLRSAFHRLAHRDAASWRHYSAIADDFARRSGAAARMRERNNIKLHWQRLGSWERRAWAFDHTEFGGTGFFPPEYGLDMRDPGGDRRLVEFCLALPDEFYLKEGMPRRFARLGLAHLIPEAIRFDPARGRQDVDWAHRMKRNAAAINRALAELSGDAALAAHLDIGEMQRLWRRFDAVDWRHAPLDDVVRYKQGLMGGLAFAQFVRWFEQRN